MKRSTEKILVSHVGSLPAPEKLSEVPGGADAGPGAGQAVLAAAVADIVRTQEQAGIDIVNDGELAKTGGFSRYAAQRMNGIEQVSVEADDLRWSADRRDRAEFPGFYSHDTTGFARSGRRRRRWACTAPLTYAGHDQVAADIERLRAAAAGSDAEPFLTAVAPGTVEHWLMNQYYPDQESFLTAIADVMHEEYRAITDAGIVLQVDNPDLPDAWQLYPEMDVPAYRRYAALRVEALNHALDGLPEQLVRLHVCWGSYHGPHKNDIPLRDIVDLVLSVRAMCYSVEGANPVHEHEWQIWEDASLPDGKVLMTGAVGHSSNLIEHPDLVAQRVLRLAAILGRENVIAGTDCGLGHRVAHPEICWAKLQSLAEGARRASARLWNGQAA